MRAARNFVSALERRPDADRLARLTCETYGSLAATGRGHGTDRAMTLGFLGHDPETIDPDQIPAILALDGRLKLPGGKCIDFDSRRDLEFKRYEPLPNHPNGMRFAALDAAGQAFFEETWYSLGGGFIVRDDDFGRQIPSANLPHSFTSGAELLDRCERAGLSIAEIMLANESALRSEA
jgi:L-serine dehydratase